MSASRRVASQDRGRKTQLRVLEGAAVVFSEAGYGAASLRQISNASGVSLGAINFHFGSKEQIALAVIQEQHRRAISLSQRTVGLHDSTIERLIRLSRAAAEQLMTDRVVQAGVELSMQVGDFVDPTARSYDGWSRELCAQMQRGLDSGELESELDATRLAETCLACFTGVQLLSRVRADRRDLLPHLRDLWSLILPGIVPADRVALARTVLSDVLPQTN